MTATGASGTTAVRYGTMRENVRGLTVVLADGRVITTGGRARKSSAGYDLTRLFVASEGTLGIITEITLRLQPLPEAVAAAVCAFRRSIRPRSGGDRDDSARHSRRADRAARRGADGRGESHARLDYPVAADAVLRVPRPHRARRQRAGARRSQAIAAEHAGSGFAWVTRLEDRTRLWRARHDAYYATLALRPGSKAWTTDACVPISRLADCIVETKADLAASPLIGTLVGHVGDGNFHMHVPRRSRSSGGDGRSQAPHRSPGRHARSRWAGRAPASTASASARSGSSSRSTARPSTSCAVKHALDPLGILNPGKIF